MDSFSSRTIALIGQQAYDRLKSSMVAVIGLGGVGGFTAEALARAGIGSLLLADGDNVSHSNRNRQIVALTDTVGLPKVGVMKQRIKLINPDCQVTCINEFLLPDNIPELLDHPLTAIADCVDTVACKVFLAKYAQDKNIFIISAMGAGNKIRPDGFKIADIYKTEGCPLAKVMRRELRKQGVTALKTVYSPELPSRFDQNDKGTPASISYMPAIAGTMLAGEIIKTIAKL